MAVLLSSTLNASAVDDGTMSQERADEFLEAIASTGTEVRSSYSQDGHGNREAEAKVTGFTAPGGVEMWAVTYEDNEVAETAVHESREDAEQSYESQVRDLAACGESPWWDVSDVPGIALAAIEYTEEVRDEDGRWHTVTEDGTDRLSAGEMAKVGDAAAVLLERAALDQDDRNELSALQAAVGIGPEGAQVTGRRVTVRGTAATGPVAHVMAAAFEPVRPTEAQVDAYRELLQRVEEEYERENDLYPYASDLD
ncbi:hypothetical protein NW249_23730 [Streptomyces sp. OUCMDZ-4982]|uniref:hypothetical protein n=1 Tax=Streptomyces sp. OUCMDZ-4982 TaxID=2973090 RepID=UPI00215BB051|nr:hypothetical protein [Streptomyces sp. OUCMDZ-4982]MCR8945132.1 hypothetical protein [Streptomyces sp. OUCMDZ-4982]